MRTTITYNQTDLSDILTVNGIRGRGITPSTIDVLNIPGMVGVHLLHKKRIERVIGVDFTIAGDKLTSLRDVVNSASQSLDLDEISPLVFSDEPNKTYYAISNADADIADIREAGQGTLTFVCPNPYKYAPERTAILGGQGTIINVPGTAPTSPIFELDVTEDTTFVMVANENNEYMMLGKPFSAGQNVFEKYERILFDDASSLVGWTTANAGEIDGTIAGTMTSNGYRFQTADYGTGTSWHGPAIKTSLSEALSDFRLEANVTFENTEPEDIGRAEIYQLDANGNQLAKVSIKDVLGGKSQSVGEVRAGGSTTNHFLIAESGDNGWEWNDFQGLLRIEREGNVWRAYIAKIVDGKHTSRRSVEWRDNANQFTSQVAQVVVHTGQHTAYQTPLQGIDSISAYKINQDVGVPYIAKQGDKVTFNHQTNELLINGEPVKKLKDFGGTYFKLQPGNNKLAILGAGSGTVTFRPAYK